MKNKNGITLIALIITIIVLLILAGISISMVVGDNGILNQASKAKRETRVVSVEEARDIWFAEKNVDNQTNSEDARSLQEVLEELENQGLITYEEKIQIEEHGYVNINSKNISFTNGIESQSFTITSSKDVVEFVKTIKKGDVIQEKNEYINYTIEGISTKQDSGYVNTGSVIGKSGYLEVIGDIQDSTFKYTLTDFMNGDEKFWVKIDIDGEKYYQDINVIQGDEVKYEEDFEGIIIGEDYISTYEVVEDERFSNGKAIKFYGIHGEKIAFQFGVVARSVDLLTMIPAIDNITGVSSSVMFSFYSDFERNNKLKYFTRFYDCLEYNKEEWQTLDNIITLEQSQKVYIDIGIHDAYTDEQYPQYFNRSNEFYLDAIIIKK